jgi:hypothetical protein
VTQLKATGMVARAIRGALLDKDIYREVASAKSLDNEAWLLIGISMLAGGLVTLLYNPSITGLMTLLSGAAIRLFAWMAAILAVQLVASSWLKRRVGFDEYLRALAYAQSPMLLQVLPVVGPLVSLWVLGTAVAAIRDVAASETAQAGVLAVAGAVAFSVVLRMLGGTF